MIKTIIAGIWVCIVTLGAEGALAFQPNAAWQVKAMELTPIDTTAAGDAFVGAFAAAIVGGASLPEALQTASAAGGLACLTRGAQSSLPFKDAIEARRGNIPPTLQVAG